MIHTVTYHARTDMIKDRNGKDLTEPKEIKKRWQEYTHTHTHTQKVLMTWITMMVWSPTYNWTS